MTSKRLWRSIPPDGAPKASRPQDFGKAPTNRRILAGRTGFPLEVTRPEEPLLLALTTVTPVEVDELEAVTQSLGVGHKATSLSALTSRYLPMSEVDVLRARRQAVCRKTYAPPKVRKDEFCAREVIVVKFIS